MIAILIWGERRGVIVTSTGHEYVGGTRGYLCIVSWAADVLEMSIVRERRGVGGVCEMCVFGSER